MTSILASMQSVEIQQLFYREADPQWRVKTHYHNVHQWYVCVHGSLRVQIEGESFDLRSETSVIVPPLAKRELFVPRRAPGYVVAIFDPQGFDLSNLGGKLLILPANLREDLHALIAELRSPQDDSQVLIQALLVRLLIGQKRAPDISDCVSALNSGSHASVIEAAEKFMTENLSESIHRSDIAAAVHLSECQLARAFRAVTGVTVLERLTALRIAKAKNLLLESTLSVSQIAGAVGIASFSHFSKVFKKNLGVSPGDYRRSGGTAWVKPESD